MHLFLCFYLLFVHACYFLLINVRTPSLLLTYCAHQVIHVPPDTFNLIRSNELLLEDIKTCTSCKIFVSEPTQPKLAAIGDKPLLPIHSIHIPYQYTLSTHPIYHIHPAQSSRHR